MPYFVIDKKCANQIYDKDDFEISLKQFKTQEEASNYLKGKQSIKPTKSKDTLSKDTLSKDTINVFTDGACSHNGSVKAKAGMGVYFSEGDPRNVSKRIVGKQSNNTGELSAILEVFTILQSEIQSGKKITIYTDSKYCINSLNVWAIKWEKNNWTKKGGIQNLDLIKRGYELCKKYKNVTLKHIKAHTGYTDELSKGNEGADALAEMSLVG
jgi:ribonuclease HI